MNVFIATLVHLVALYTGSTIDLSDGAAPVYAGLVALSAAATGAIGYSDWMASWYHRALWLIALAMVVMTIPLALTVTATLAVHMPEAIRDVYRLVVVMAAPIGILSGILRVGMGHGARH